MVDWRLVTTSLADIDPERIIWLLGPSDRISANDLLGELPGITVVQDPLDAILRAAEETPEEKERLFELSLFVKSCG
jgi:hypothetical protein